jgi:hypothetical protein
VNNQREPGQDVIVRIKGRRRKIPCNQTVIIKIDQRSLVCDASVGKPGDQIGLMAKRGPYRVAWGVVESVTVSRDY